MSLEPFMSRVYDCIRIDSAPSSDRLSYCGDGFLLLPFPSLYAAECASGVHEPLVWTRDRIASLTYEAFARVATSNTSRPP